jgi:hypothetical protein
MAVPMKLAVATRAASWSGRRRGLVVGGAHGVSLTVSARVWTRIIMVEHPGIRVVSGRLGMGANTGQTRKGGAWTRQWVARSQAQLW